MNSGFLDDSQANQTSQQLQSLKEKVHLNNGDLIELVLNSDQFVFKIKELNDLGITFILNDEFNEALVYLQEAERVLEYCASCGKTIDRLLIIFTLQNQACAYQRLWQLEKSSNYMEAIIYNMNAYLESPPSIIIDSQINNPSSVAYANLSTLVTKRLQISFYYLQFSALSSQMNKHQVALGSALNAFSMLKQLCHECYSYEKQMRKEDMDRNSIHRNILKQLSALKESVEIDRYDRYLILAKKSVKKLRHRISKKEKEENIEFQRLYEFGIGEVMQVAYAEMSSLEVEPSLKHQVKYIQKVFKAIYISITFFTIATELRLIAGRTYEEKEKKLSKEFRKSELYHLNSIIIAAKYIPCETKYLTHILKSYNNHYNIDLTIHCEESQETTHSTEIQNPGFLLTPSKPLKGIQELEVPSSTNTKFLTKLQSLTKIEELETEKAFPKVSLLHLKKRKKKIEGSKEKSESIGRKLIPSPNRKNENHKKKLSFLKKQDTQKMLHSQDKNSKRKRRKDQSKSPSRSKKERSMQSMKNKSKQKKTQRKKDRFKEQYMGESKRKKKGKKSGTQSLTKIKLESPKKVQFPCTFVTKNSLKAVKKVLYQK